MKVSISEDFCIRLTYGVGEWKVRNKDFEMFGYETSFTDGENQITIIRTCMQSGDTDVVVVYSEIDGYNYVEQEKVRTKQVAQAIRNMLFTIEQRIGHSL